ncbi:MAG TPA: cytochrome c3 family protein [Candidatus Limnocylindrales bacterium]|nr:cytochrome c3 family protein [Candidatus Limnocylindrales bacterium]
MTAARVLPLRPSRRIFVLGGGVIGASLVAALWLLLIAAPVAADGGPHVMTQNNGSLGINADGCAGCHRAHTAQGPFLINAADETALCKTCHGAVAAGATTDVMSGIQYRLNGRGATPLLGALRGGGFVSAAIDSGNPARILVSNLLSSSDDQRAKVSVLVDGTGAVDPAPVTSAHLNMAENGLSGPAVAWGNDTIGAGDKGAGPTVTLSCGSCHNPHGNGQYRILNPVPEPLGTGFVPATLPSSVMDSPFDNPDPSESDTKNYTVIQTRGTPGDLSTYLLYADDVIDAGYGPATGDYWHVRVPWNTASTATNGADAPNGVPANRVGGFVAFNTQMSAWCSSCHTRYASSAGDEPSGDAIFSFRHETVGNRACTTCHVSHGSNARMPGDFSSDQPFPNGDIVTYDIGGLTGDSRLLKVDNRGTCQLCHDPTGTVPNGTYTGPVPAPGTP